MADDLTSSPSAVSDVLRRLAITFSGFEARLEATPLIRKLTVAASAWKTTATS